MNTARSFRASIEFCLGAFRSNIEISAFTEAKQQSCFCCGILEKHNSINETGRNPIFHLLFDGGPARFLRNHLKNYARRILDQSFDITLNAIIFNEVPFYIQGVSKKRYFLDFLSYFSSRGRILLFHMCFGIRISSPFHLAIQKVSIQNINR